MRVHCRLTWDYNRIELGFSTRPCIEWAREHADEIDAVIARLDREHRGRAINLSRPDDPDGLREIMRLVARELRLAFRGVDFDVVGSWEEPVTSTRDHIELL